MEHTFHTRHDFTPEFGWAAFQLLAELGQEGTTPAGLETAARARWRRRSPEGPTCASCCCPCPNSGWCARPTTA